MDNGYHLHPQRPRGSQSGRDKEKNRQKLVWRKSSRVGLLALENLHLPGDLVVWMGVVLENLCLPGFYSIPPQLTAPGSLRMHHLKYYWWLFSRPENSLSKDLNYLEPFSIKIPRTHQFNMQQSTMTFFLCDTVAWKVVTWMCGQVLQCRHICQFFNQLQRLATYCHKKMLPLKLLMHWPWRVDFWCNNINVALKVFFWNTTLRPCKLITAAVFCSVPPEDP